MTAPLARTCAFFVLANLLAFAAYRVAFLLCFARPFPASDLPRVLIYGARIDLALIGVELMLFVLAYTFLKFTRRVPRTLALSAITGANAAFVTVDIFFYAERNQHVGEMLMAFIFDPREMGMAVVPFVKHNAPTTVIFFVAAAGFAWLAIRRWRRSRTTTAETITRRDRGISFALALIACLFLAQPVQVKYGHSPIGWGMDVVLAKHYMRFNSFVLNQAVVNPLYELCFDLAPAAITTTASYTMTEAEALTICDRVLDLEDGAATARYPLSREFVARFDLGITNLILIQVEGLTESLVEHEVDGVPLMPYLRQLRKEGLYFTNAFQSFNDTVGSVFSTASSYHKSCFQEQTRRLTTYELQGSFASLPRVFPSEHEHYFYEGFRQSAADFLSFMGSQGYKTMCYEDFSELVAGRAAHDELEGDLGVHDGPAMDELARIILAQGDTPFTAHLMTGTTHSPWQTPPSFTRSFKEPAFNTFAYFDECLRTFMATVRAKPGLAENTLFVIVADHTSVTLTDDLMERIRVPLLFLHPRIDPAASPFAEATPTDASHVDVLPTILDLMGGRHPYAGMGQSLLRPESREKGAISGSRGRGHYIKGGHVLHFTPRSKAAVLLAFDGRVVDQRDISGANPDITASLLEEYLAQYELARRLAINKRVYPPH